MPEVAIALKTPCQPWGLKPWSVKFPPWNAAKRNATMTSRMMNSFHHTSTLLMRANHRMPK